MIEVHGLSKNYGAFTAVHDLSDGGLAVGLAEMAAAFARDVLAERLRGAASK